MRSYHAHLETASGSSPKLVTKPTLRSSAIFPAIFEPNAISTRILFMGYWVLKRHIKEILCIATLRSNTGKVLYRSTEMFLKPKAYHIELQDYMKNSGLSLLEPFFGSLEVEFFSLVPLVFPYPATVLNYYGPSFCTVVHTAQRIYNDYDDMISNSETSVPEAGFNLYVEDDKEPFFSLINGIEPVHQCKLHMTFYNTQQESLNYELNLGQLNPYQMLMVYPSQYVDLKAFLKGRVGTAKIHFHVNWIFPRLIVGNMQKSPSTISITHTYYDCSDAKSSKNYWKSAEPGWYPASLMIPLTLTDKQFTNVYFYPIYSPTHFTIDVEIYQQNGKRLFTLAKILCIEPDTPSFQKIDFKSLCQKQGIRLDQPLAARLIANPLKADEAIPARIKLGLDLGQENGSFPCNICTNLVPFNPSLESKPSTFRWLPILSDQFHSQAWIMNSSASIDYQRHADITLTFYREQDEQTLVRKITLSPNGFLLLELKNDAELTSFFENQVGWLTVVSNTPHILTYYFAMHPSGFMGGDHGF